MIGSSRQRSFFKRAAGRCKAVGQADETRPGAARGKQYFGPDAPLSHEAGKVAGALTIEAD